MRTTLLPLLLLVGGSFAEAVKAQTYCAVSNQGATNCAFTSVERCRDETRADGGFCIPQAPVGHRQPRVGDVPNEKNLTDPNDPLSKENALLDRKIKSICRGC